MLRRFGPIASALLVGGLGFVLLYLTVRDVVWTARGIRETWDGMGVLDRLFLVVGGAGMTMAVALGLRLWRECTDHEVLLQRFREDMDRLTDVAEGMIQDGVFYGPPGLVAANRWLDSFELILRKRLASSPYDAAVSDLHSRLRDTFIVSHGGAYDYTQHIAAAVAVASAVREATAAANLRAPGAGTRRDLRAFKDWSLPA